LLDIRIPSVVGGLNAPSHLSAHYVQGRTYSYCPWSSYWPPLLQPFLLYKSWKINV